MPDNEIALNLIRTSKCPIAAPSANKFGNLSPVSADHVRKQLPGVDYILDGGQTTIGIESTIVSIDGNICTLLRPGKITIDDNIKCLTTVFSCSILHKTEELIAPGLLKSHYSPTKPLVFFKRHQIDLPEKSGLILHSFKRKLPNGEK
jgi:L-threonylcarbamoyladenylate synthase